MRQNIKELFQYYDYLLKVEHLLGIEFGANLEKHKFGSKDAKDTFIYRLNKEGVSDFVSGVNDFIENAKPNEDFAYSFAIVGGKARDVENNNKKDKYFPILIAQIADINAIEQEEKKQNINKKKIKRLLSHLEFLIGDGEVCPDEMPFIFLSPKIIQHTDDESLSIPQLNDEELDNVERREAVFKDILRCRLESFLQSHGLDMAWGQDWYVCMYKSSFTGGLRRIYKHLLEKKDEGLGLLDKYFQFEYPKSQKSFFGIKQELEYSKKHLGSLDVRHALTPSQRIAVYTFLDKDLKITPINGGPGTGKTSVLRAMFADFVVKTAMNWADCFLNKGHIPITAPFVCTSTNNQALININEGIASQLTNNALDNKGNLLYERWISDQDPKEKQQIIDNKSFLVPNLKTKIDKQENLDISNKEITDIVNAASRVKKNEAYYIEKCESFLGIKYQTHIPIEFYRLVIEELLGRIQSNKEQICAEFEKVRADELKQIEAFEQEALKLAGNNQEHEFNLRSFLRKFRENPSQLPHFNSLSTKHRDIEESIKDYREKIAKETGRLGEQNRELTKTLRKLEAYKDKLPRTLFQKFLIVFCYFFVQKICIPKLEKDKAFREGKICEIEQEQKKLQKKIDVLQHIDRKLVECIEFCKENWSGDLPSEAQSTFESIKDKKGASIFDKGNEITMAYKNAADELKKRNELDTKERVENFYYSLHILEGLFFAKDKLSANRESNQAFYCPCCNSIMDKKQTKDADEYYLECQSCGRRLSFKNLKRDSRIGQLADNEALLKKLLLDSVVECPEGGYFALEVKEVFLNVYHKAKKEEVNSILSNQLLTQMLPIFPIISVTCNSFGSIIKPQEGFLKYLLIDEAGTIPPSKAVVLYSAEKAIFFGDTKQLKPVFNITHSIEQDLLRSFVNDKDYRKTINRHFSCGDYLGDSQYKAKNVDKKVRTGANYDKERLANNAMDVANNAAPHIILPYNPSKLRGDIWLKEHFRCGKPIADIANVMTYNEEMIIESKHEGSVIWVENVGDKNGTSNEEEIKQVYDYLSQELDKLREKVGVSSELDNARFCKERIGIITPFTEQGRKMREHFSKNDTPLSHIKIGTVHTFQGSERDIIIFSTVYGKNATDPKKFFFNRGETDLLNVAVTRAKKVLIIFGNKELLGQDGCHSKHLCEAKPTYQAPARSER